MQEKPLNSRQQQAIETKKIIFDSAIALLDEKDFEQITIRDIVKKAGVSIGTFYHYYQTKLDVYYETYGFADEYFKTTVRKEVSKKKSFKEKILLFFEHYSLYNSKLTDFDLTRILYNPQNKYFDRNVEDGMIPLLKEIIQGGLDSRELKSSKNNDEISLFIMICVRGHVYHWCTNDGKYDLCSAINEQVSMLLTIFM